MTNELADVKRLLADATRGLMDIYGPIGGCIGLLCMLSVSMIEAIDSDDLVGLNVALADAQRALDEIAKMVGNCNAKLGGRA